MKFFFIKVSIFIQYFMKVSASTYYHSTVSARQNILCNCLYKCWAIVGPAKKPLFCEFEEKEISYDSRNFYCKTLLTKLHAWKREEKTWWVKGPVPCGKIESKWKYKSFFFKFVIHSQVVSITASIFRG